MAALVFDTAMILLLPRGHAAKRVLAVRPHQKQSRLQEPALNRFICSPRTALV